MLVNINLLISPKIMFTILSRHADIHNRHRCSCKDIPNCLTLLCCDHLETT